MLSSWQQDSPLVGDDPEEYCIDNIRVVVLHVNPVRKTWNATCSCLEPTGNGYSCRHILCVALQLDPVRFRQYHMDLSMFNVLFRKTKGSVGLCVLSDSTSTNSVAGAAQLRARQKAVQQCSIFTAQANYSRVFAECRDLCLQVQNSKDATDKMITHLGKFKKDLEKFKKLDLQGEVYPVADAPDLVFQRSGDKGRADVMENGAADTGSSRGCGLDRTTPRDSNDSMTSVTSVLRGISTRALQLRASVEIIREGERETFTRVLGLRDMNMLSPSAVKSMFEALPLHEPFWPSQRTSGAAWQETDLTRFMLYTLKCSSTHITMDEIDAESAETRRDISGVSIDTDGVAEGRSDISCVDVEERRRMSEVACEMVRKAAVRKPAYVKPPPPPPPPTPPPPPPPSVHTELVCAETGVLAALTSTESAEHGSSDDDNLDDGKSGPSGASQKALPALQKKQGQKRRIRSSGESHPPQVKRVQATYSGGSVAAEGKRSARMRTPKNLDL